jgi:hypothetical protein
MGIYVDGRVKNELDELLATKAASDLTARDVHLIASMHYLDDQPMLRAAEFFGLTAKDDVEAGGLSEPLDAVAATADDAASTRRPFWISAPVSRATRGAWRASSRTCA